MTAFFSDKLRIVSFFAIVMVIYYHAGFPDSVNESMLLPVIVRSSIAGIWGPCAVPLFYAISGFLFFYNINELPDIFKKMRKRVKTLLIPFVIAALAYPMFFIVLQAIPGASSYVNGESYLTKISTSPFLKTLSALFYDSGNGSPWAYHLWFLRDLIIIIALMPLVYFLKKYFGRWCVLIILALYLFFPNIRFLYGMFWFISGGVFLDKIVQLPKWPILIMLGLFLVMAIFRQFHEYDEWKYFKIIEISLGLCAIWGGYDLMVSKSFSLSNMHMLSLACQFTFFLYLYHEPLYHVLVNGIPLILGKNGLAYTLSFLLSPILFTPFMIMVGYVIRKKANAFYRIIVGGR